MSSRMNAFRLNVAGFACQTLGTLFLLLDSIRVGIRLPREGITLGDPPAVDKWYYHWASPFGFFLLLTGFALCGIALWMSRPPQHPAPRPPSAPPAGGAPAGGAVGGDDGELLELRTNYWLKRLDHTLTHTQTASRLIYVIDGAVLALMYFIVQTLGASRQVLFLMGFPTLLLMFLNLFHARLVAIQRSHYVGTNMRLLQLLNQEDIQHQTPRQYFASTHGLYCGMHLLIAFFLGATAIMMFLYGGLGWFADIKIPKAGS